MVKSSNRKENSVNETTDNWTVRRGILMITQPSSSPSQMVCDHILSHANKVGELFVRPLRYVYLLPQQTRQTVSIAGVQQSVLRWRISL